MSQVYRADFVGSGPPTGLIALYGIRYTDIEVRPTPKIWSQRRSPQGSVWEVEKEGVAIQFATAADLATERQQRIAADVVLQTNINIEHAGWVAGDVVLQTQIDNIVAILPVPSALTRVNDTNVVLTLGGTPNTALLQAVSLTLGWLGQLSIARGGTGLAALGSALQVLRVNAGATSLEYINPPWIPANPAIVPDTKTKITYDADGLVTAGTDATTTDIAEGTRLYFTEARVLATLLAGGDYVTPGLVADGISVITAFGYLQAGVTNLETLYAGLPDFLATLNDDTPSINYMYNGVTDRSSWELVNVGPGVTTKGTASKSATVGINAKGQVTALSDQDIQILPSQVTGLPGYLYTQSSVNTTNATPTPFTGIACASATNTTVYGYVVARRTGGVSGSAEDGAGFRFEADVKNSGGTATIIGSIVTTVGESLAGYNITLGVSSGNLIVNAVGLATTNIHWEMYHWKLTSVS